MNVKDTELEDIVRKKYRNREIRTDSDIIDLAEEYGMGYREICRILDRLRVECTTCEGCKHTGERFFWKFWFHMWQM